MPLDEAKATDAPTVSDSSSTGTPTLEAPPTVADGLSKFWENTNYPLMIETSRGEGLELSIYITTVLRLFFIQMYKLHNHPDETLLSTDTEVLNVTHDNWSEDELQQWDTIIRQDVKAEAQPKQKMNFNADKHRMIELTKEIVTALMKDYTDVFWRIQRQDYKILAQALLERFIQYMKQHGLRSLQENPQQQDVVRLLVKAITDGSCSEQWAVRSVLSSAEVDDKLTESVTVRTATGELRWQVEALMAHIGIRTEKNKFYTPEALKFYNPFGYRAGTRDEAQINEFVESQDVCAHHSLTNICDKFKKEVITPYKKDHLAGNLKFLGRWRIDKVENRMRELLEEENAVVEKRQRHTLCVNFVTFCWKTIVESSSTAMKDLTLSFFRQLLSSYKQEAQEQVEEPQIDQLKEALIAHRLLTPR
jgi:hypothetical protein